MKIAYLVIIIAVLFFPSITSYKPQGYNRYTVMLDGNVVGITSSLTEIYDDYRQARLELVLEDGKDATDELYMSDYSKITYEGEEVIFGTKDDDRVVIDNMKNIIRDNKISSYEKSYSVKAGTTVVNVETAEDVKYIFQTIIDKYSGGIGFEISIDGDANRNLSVLSVSINKTDEAASVNKKEDNSFVKGGVENIFEENDYAVENTKANLSFDSFDYGVVDMAFSKNIEVVESYVPRDEVLDKETAKLYFSDPKEVQEIYKVQSGDTLSEISMKVNLPLDQIIALNASLDDASSLIVPGQELVITSPKPSLSVLWSYQARIKEIYDLPIEYKYNDSWYTNQVQTLRQPSAGSHEAVLLVTNENANELASTVLYEEVLNEAVAKLVEKGTIVPPTYIKPLAGGRMTSQFGPRKSPKKGASSNHKGIDWATPTGTTVVASCGGTVAFAGWGRGYGNVIYINHPDGRQTRYGHLSKIYVTTGQKVSQGERIAASGNTGVSTGPHVHFEILINGSQVNPLSYIN